MKRLKIILSLCMMITGVAQAAVINITGANGELGNTDNGTMEPIDEPDDNTVLTSLSWTVSGLTIDADGTANDTATFTVTISPVGTGTINWDDATISEFDYSNGSFNGTDKGITFGAITVSGTSSGGLEYQLNSAAYKEFTVRRWGAGDSFSIVGDVTTTTITHDAAAAVALNDTTFTAKFVSGAWNGLDIDFTVDVTVPGGGYVPPSRLSGGVLVAVDFADGTAVADLLPENGNYIVHGLFTTEVAVEMAKQEIVDAGLHGKVSCELYDGQNLPYVDGLVNRVYCSASSTVPTNELMRVIAPAGRLMVKNGVDTWQETIKAIPDGMDEWGQFLHGADNNGVSLDDVGPPQRLRWHDDPEHGRHKRNAPSFSNMVSADGVLFTIEDTGTTEDVSTKTRDYLVARDAFNGIELWRLKMPDEWRSWQGTSIKSAPTQQQRCLAAVGETVYFCAGRGSAVMALDTRSGETNHVYEATTSTAEFLVDDNILYGIKGDAYAGGTKNSESVVDAYALDVELGTILWSHEIPNEYTGGTLAVKGANLVYMSRDGLTCLNSASGDVVWGEVDVMTDCGREPTYYSEFDDNIQPTVVLTDDMVYCTIDDNLDVSKGDRNNSTAGIVAYSLVDGSTVWTAQDSDGYMKSPDLFVADGLVWGLDYDGRNPTDGTIERTLTQVMDGPMGHKRCYRNRITHRFYINSASGGTDLLALDPDNEPIIESPNPWLRSACGLSMTPANGMLYTSPYVCQCSMAALLTGVNAVYNGCGNTGDVFTVEIDEQLVKGPAFGTVTTGVDATLDDWPTYRYSGTRSAVSAAPAAASVITKWNVDIGSNPTAPIVANDTVYVADRDTYILYALNRENGTTRWTYTADGCLDSPPTYYKGMVLFGTRTGWVYCLDASDGSLVWKFTGLPNQRLMCSKDRLESAWPVSGSVMVFEDTVYFSAGRSSFLDGGIGVFALDPTSGALKHSKMVRGPYQEDHPTFPVYDLTVTDGAFYMDGFKADIFSNNGGELFVRNQPFTADLEEIEPDGLEPHIMASTGMLNDSPTHRTYWTVDRSINYPGSQTFFGSGPEGDITAFDGEDFYEVRAYTNGRNLQTKSYSGLSYDEKDVKAVDLHRIYSGSRTSWDGGGNDAKKGSGVPGIGTWEQNWEIDVPFAGHAIAAARNTVMVAGVPLCGPNGEVYTEDETDASYAGENGGIAWLLSESDGSKLQEIYFDAEPVWDGIAIARSCYFISLKDGSVICLSGEPSSTDEGVPFVAASWNFNEGKGAVATDISWNGHHGTVENATWSDEGALNFNGVDASVSVPAAVFANVSNEVTIAMKVYGGDTQPAQHSSFVATDADGNRVLSIHLPWSNSAIIWDAGNTSGEYDRLKEDAEAADFMGQWNHWVFTKNAAAGTMAMYLNGELFVSGSGNYSTMSSIVSAHIGSASTNQYYDGMMDDVQVYNACLTGTEVYDLYHLTAPATTYSSWFSTHNLAGSDAEPDADSLDGDGLSNAVEAWLGTDPAERDSDVFKISSDSKTTTITHPQSENVPSDLSGLYEWSTNLTDWYECDGSDGPTDGPKVMADRVTVGTTTTVTIEASEVLDHAFIRMSVKQE